MKKTAFYQIIANVADESLRIAAPIPEFKVGDVYAGTWGYSMTLAKFAVITQVLPKSLKFDILENQTVSSVDPNGFMPRVVPNMHRKKKTVTVRAKIDSYGYIKVDGCLMKKWDGKPI
jgi:hypothetical protein